MNSLDVKRTGRKPKPKPKAGRPKLYPWNEWSDGSWWEVTCETDSERDRLRQALYKAAQRMGRSLESEIQEGTLYFRFKRKSA